MATALTIGVAKKLTQNVSYALPAKVVMVSADGAIDHSIDGTSWFSTASGAILGTTYLRSPVVNTTVICKEVSTAGQGGGSSSGSLKVTDYIAVGNNPAGTGAIRLSNDNDIIWRHSDGTDNNVAIKNDVPYQLVLSGHIVPAADQVSQIGLTFLRWLNLFLSSFAAIGTNPAQSGDIRLSSAGAIKSRRVDNAADANLVSVNNNLMNIGDVGANMTGIAFQHPNIVFANAALSGVLTIALGANPSSTGHIRMINNGTIKFRNNANNADITVLTLVANDNLQLNGAIVEIQTGGTTRWYIDGGGFVPYINDAYSIGIPGTRVKNIYVSPNGAIMTGIKAGAPVDADVTNPTDGMIRIDSTNNKIWVRIGGVWKGAVLS
jgi:hypothetical protein